MARGRYQESSTCVFFLKIVVLAMDETKNLYTRVILSLFFLFPPRAKVVLGAVRVAVEKIAVFDLNRSRLMFHSLRNLGGSADHVFSEAFRLQLHNTKHILERGACVFNFDAANLIRNRSIDWYNLGLWICGRSIYLVSPSGVMTVSNHDHLYSAVKKTWIYVRKKKSKSLSHQDVYEL
jgi:hypothetical protein